MIFINKFNNKEFFKKINNNQGATPMEILGVLFVIILIIITSLGYYRKINLNGRNLRRVQDMSQIKTAFRIYYNEKGEYPVCNSPTYGLKKYGGATKTCFSRLKKHLVKEGYLDQLPQDPIAEGDYCYYYGSDGSQAFLAYKEESLTGKEKIKGIEIK